MPHTNIFLLLSVLFYLQFSLLFCTVFREISVCCVWILDTRSPESGRTSMNEIGGVVTAIERVEVE